MQRLYVCTFGNEIINNEINNLLKVGEQGNNHWQIIPGHLKNFQACQDKQQGD